jgi:hypothetical protein
LAVYPIMSKRLVDLHDHDSVVANLAIMKLSFSLPPEGPNPFFKRPSRGALRSDRRMSLRILQVLPRERDRQIAPRRL